MIIKILGTRGEIEASNPRYSKHSGVLIDNKILIDLGEKAYLQYKPELILLTHLHPDHAFFIGGKEILQTNIPVYAPEQSKKLKDIKIISTPLSKNGYLIIPIPTVHSVKVRSQGYLISKGKNLIFYSGDIVHIEKRFYDKLKKTDAVITEASFIRKGGMVRQHKSGQSFGHAGVPDLIRLFKNFTDHIIFTHFGTWFMKDVAAGKKKIRDMEEGTLKLSIAHDGKEYNIQ